MYTALIVLSIIAIVLLGAGALLLWRPWARRAQQEEDADERREAELDELRHQFEVERLRGAIHRRRVFDHAIWPTHGLLTAVEDAVGHRMTEHTVAPLVGCVTEQTLQEILGTNTQVTNAPGEEPQNDQAPGQRGRLRALSARFWNWLKTGLKWAIAILVVIAIVSLVTSFFNGSRASSNNGSVARTEAPRAQISVTPSDNGSFIAVLDSSSPGWTEVRGLPEGKWQVSASGNYRWDSMMSHTVTPAGDSWTPETVPGSDQFPLPESPIVGLLARTGNTIHYVGSNWFFAKDQSILLFGLNERWIEGAWNDQFGLITIIFSPA